MSPQRNCPFRVRTRHLSSQPPISLFQTRYRLKQTGNMYRDELGRERISWPRTGQLSVYLFASLFHSSTSAIHATNLEEILKPIVTHEKKGAVTITCDGGPDWSSKFTPNIINFG